MSEGTPNNDLRFCLFTPRPPPLVNRKNVSVTFLLKCLSVCLSQKMITFSLCVRVRFERCSELLEVCVSEKKIITSSSGSGEAPVGQEKWALTQEVEIKHKIRNLSWVQERKARRWEHPKMYPLEHYPGPTIPPARSRRPRLWIWHCQYVVYLILFPPNANQDCNGARRGAINHRLTVQSVKWPRCPSSNS